MCSCVQDLNSAGFKLMAHSFGSGKRYGTAGALPTIMDFEFQGSCLEQPCFAELDAHGFSVHALLKR
jgi:hypothetical protein